jgi:hypothetical protein
MQRYKGLGEMNPEQLWETTMDPANRTLLLVTIEDAAEADRTFDMLMGAAVPPRKRFIQTHAREVRNLVFLFQRSKPHHGFHFSSPSGCLIVNMLQRLLKS